MCLLNLGIRSATDETIDQLYTVDVPSGRKCVYPEHPGGLSHISFLTPKFEGTSSFLQTSKAAHKINSHLFNEQRFNSSGKKPFEFRQMTASKSKFGMIKKIRLTAVNKLQKLELFDRLSNRSCNI